MCERSPTLCDWTGSRWWAGPGVGPMLCVCRASAGAGSAFSCCSRRLAPLGLGGLNRDEWLTGMDPDIGAEPGVGGGR